MGTHTTPQVQNTFGVQLYVPSRDLGKRFWYSVVSVMGDIANTAGQALIDAKVIEKRQELTVERSFDNRMLKFTYLVLFTDTREWSASEFRFRPRMLPVHFTAWPDGNDPDAPLTLYTTDTSFAYEAEQEMLRLLNEHIPGLDLE